MDIDQLRSLVTLASFAAFIGLAAFAWWPSRRALYDAAARLPFDGEPEPAADAAPSNRPH